MAKGKKLPSEAEDVKAPRTADGLSDYVADKAAIKSKKPPAVRGNEIYTDGCARVFSLERLGLRVGTIARLADVGCHEPIPLAT